MKRVVTQDCQPGFKRLSTLISEPVIHLRAKQKNPDPGRLRMSEDHIHQILRRVIIIREPTPQVPKMVQKITRNPVVQL